MKILPVETEYIVDDEFVSLYERVSKLTCGSSHVDPQHYHIYPKCHLTIDNDDLLYYIYEITGDLGEDGNGEFTDPFKITLSDGRLMVKIGNIDSLLTALDLLEKENNNLVPILEYKRICCPFIDTEVHEWMMKGCPEIGISYKLNINRNDNSLSMLMISTDYIKINFLGFNPSFINIVHNITDERWIFIEDSEYLHINANGSADIRSSSCFYPKRTSPPQRMTSDLAGRAILLLFPIKSALYTCCDS